MTGEGWLALFGLIGTLLGIVVMVMKRRDERRNENKKALEEIEKLGDEKTKSDLMDFWNRIHR